MSYLFGVSCLMAEKTTDRVQQHLGAPAGDCVTASHLLFGSEGYSAMYWRTLASAHSIPEASARHLAGKFGMASSEVLRLSGGKPDLLLPWWRPPRHFAPKWC